MAKIVETIKFDKILNFLLIMDVVVLVLVVVDPKLLSSSLLYSQCQAGESACLLQLV